MRNAARRFTSLVILLLVPFFSGCSEAPQEETAAVVAEPPVDATTTPATECRLTMGWDPWAPYQYRDAAGNITGLDVEIARAIASTAGCELDFADGDWMDMLNRLRDGDVDVLAGATVTPGRAEFAEFTAPYRSESFTVFTLADNTAIREASSLQTLLTSDARIGTVAEYYYGADVLELLDSVAAEGRLEEATVAEINYQRLLDGEIDAFLDDPFVAASILHGRDWGDRIVATEIGTANGEVTFMVSRQSVAPENIQRFKDALERIRADGRLAAIIDDYLH